MDAWDSHESLQVLDTALCNLSHAVKVGRLEDVLPVPVDGGGQAVLQQVRDRYLHLVSLAHLHRTVVRVTSLSSGQLATVVFACLYSWLVS